MHVAQTDVKRASTWGRWSPEDVQVQLFTACWTTG